MLFEDLTGRYKAKNTDCAHGAGTSTPALVTVGAKNMSRKYLKAGATARSISTNI
jgi:uncharacterized membrane protein